MDKALWIIKLIPAIIAVIKTVEEMFPLPGAGKDKLKLVHDMLVAVHGNLDDIWPKIEAIVAAVVAFANKVGVFKK
jgi:hypothetical protein